MKLTINGRLIEAKDGDTILEAAKGAGIRIPTLCYLREINAVSACRICVVQVNGSPRLVTACSAKAAEGMQVETDNEYVRKARRETLELIASDHQMECTECSRGVNCELRDLMKEYEADDRAFGIGHRARMIEDSTAYLVRDNSKCILCRRCVSTCVNGQGIGAIGVNNRGSRTNIGFPEGLTLRATECIACGQCVAACPTGALTEKDDTAAAWKALYDKEKTVVAAISPETAWSLGRLFGEKEKKDNSGKICAMLRRIGIDYVISTGCFDKEYQAAVAAAASLKKGPVFTSDCPGWKNYVKKHRPDLADRCLDVPSKAEFTAKRIKELLPGKQMAYLHVSNCLAAKTEEKQAVEAYLTSRELFHFIRRACVSNFTAGEAWEKMAPEAYSDLAAGGAPRPEEKPAVSSFTLRNGETTLQGLRLTGIGQAASLLNNESNYDVIEVRVCPGGCINGGGAPHKRPEERR